MTATSRRIAWGALLVFLAFAGWRAFTLGAADDLAITEPALALSWRPDHPRATFEAAQAAVRAGQATDVARPQVLRALQLDPLDGRSYRLLGELALRTADHAGAAEAFALAGQRAPRDLPTQEWLIQDALQRHDGATAVRHLDYLLRVEPERFNANIELMIALATFGPTQPPLAAALARRPDWRGQFVRVLTNRPGVSTTAGPLMAALAAAPGGLTADEFALWLDRLADDGHADQAYVAWVQSLPEARRKVLPPLFNGDFSDPPSGTGFDWRFDSEHGADVGVATLGDDNPALRLAFDGRKVTSPPVAQRLLLAPGDYRLDGQARLVGLDTAQGLAWRMRCSGRRTPPFADEGPRFRGSQEWQPFSAIFHVPAGCASQWLELQVVARAPVEQRIQGEAWFDRLRLVRR